MSVKHNQNNLFSFNNEKRVLVKLVWEPELIGRLSRSATESTRVPKKNKTTLLAMDADHVRALRARRDITAGQERVLLGLVDRGVVNEPDEVLGRHDSGGRRMAQGVLEARRPAVELVGTFDNLVEKANAPSALSVEALGR